MNELALSIYADASVFGGVFDDEFRAASEKFFDLARSGYFDLASSIAVDAEIARALLKVREFYDSVVPLAQAFPVSREAIELQRAYIKEGIVTARSSTDALHVAIASVNHCDVIASWNFSHIVHFQKIPLYNAVNTLRGFPGIRIHSPQEIVHDE